MTARAATAEVFWTAFRALPKLDREAFIERLLRDGRLRQDMLDIVTALQRRRERSIPYERVRAHLKASGRL